MAGRAGAWRIALVVLAWLVPHTHGSALRSLHESHRQSLKVEDQRLSVHEQHVQLRAAMLKTMPPFELIHPETFLSLVGSVPTDVLLLFFSPTCPDCEKLMPSWARVAGLFEDNQDLTILSVSDDAGKAPPPYTHNENPAVFFIPKGDAAHPISFPMSYLHEFVALPETGNTDDSIVNRLLAFTHSHLTTASRATSPLPAAPAAETAAPRPALSESQSGSLTARLLATLKAKEAESFQDQLNIVYEPQYQTLPVAEFLKSPTGILGPPLFQVAATYLDGLPLAQQWANQYATQAETNYRKTGWAPTREEEQSYFQDLLKYAIPLYARSIYFQRGLKG